MDRRTFLTSVGAATIAGLGSENTAALAEAGPVSSPEFYVWRQYILRNGTGPGR